MSEQIETPTVVVPPVETAPEKPRVQADALPPEALSARLESAKRAAQNELLAKLGLGSTSELDALVADRAKQIEASRTDAEKLASREVELERMRGVIASQNAAVGAAWSREAARLTAEQAAAVEAVAGDDVAKRLVVLAALAPTWGVVSHQPTPVAPVVPVVVPPATTTTSTPAPNPAGTVSPTGARAQYDAAKATNPFQAARVAEANPGLLIR